jgi:signal peptide peptidase SppA
MLLQLAEFLSQPLMLESAYTAVLSNLAQSSTAVAKREMPDVMMLAKDQASAASKSSSNVTAVLPVYGIIDARDSWILQMMGGTSLESLMEGVDICLNEPRIGQILFDFDTPGGSSSGVKVAADQLFAARGVKPMVSMVRYCMASAGYYLGAATSRIIADPTSMTGSIGVGMEHYDRSKALEQAGVTPTIWRVPEFKMEGHPAEPLSDAAKAHMQARIDSLYDDFTKDVARYRGTDQKTVKETYGMGRALNAKDSLAAGMIDRIGTYAEVVQQMASGTMARSLAQGNRMEGEVDTAVLKNRMSMMGII